MALRELNSPVVVNGANSDSGVAAENGPTLLTRREQRIIPLRAVPASYRAPQEGATNIP